MFTPNANICHVTTSTLILIEQVNELCEKLNCMQIVEHRLAQLFG